MKKLFSLFLVFSFWFFAFEFCFASDHIIISQFQVSGASATDEFIELYNPTNKDVDLFDYKVQKRSSSGASYNIIASIPEKSIIKAFSYFLIAHQNFSFQTYIKPDLIYSNYSIANDNSIVLYDADSNIIDTVGFGNCVVSENSCLANLISNQSFVRVNDYNNYGFGYGYGGNVSEILCSDFDLDNNVKDFFVLSKSSPRNSSFKNECKYVSSVINNNVEVKNVLPTQTNSQSFENIFSVNNLKNYNNAVQNDVAKVDNNTDIDTNTEDLNIEEINNKEASNKEMNGRSSVQSVSSIKPVQSVQQNIVDISDSQNLNIGEKVSLYGIVISIPNEISNKYFYLNGIQIYSSSSSFPKLNIGDKVFVSGVVSSNYGEKRIKIKNASDINIVSKNNKIESVDLINSDEEINNLTANLVFVSGTVSRKSSNKVYLLSDDVETEIYFNEKLKDIYKSLKVGDNVKILGILNKRNDLYRIMPRNLGDIEIIKEEDNNNLQAASVMENNGEVQNNLPVKESVVAQKNIIKNDNKNSLDSYSVKNNNHNDGYLKYVVLAIIFMIVFVVFACFYKTGVLLKIKLFFKILLKKFSKG